MNEKISTVIAISDIHGAFDFLKSQIEKFKLGNEEEITYLIQLGDFGIGFRPKSDQDTLYSLNKFLKLRNIIMYVIRGNHDCPDFFKGNHIYSNLQLLPDYTTLFINDKKYLFVGGAISIDRKLRLSDMQHAASYGSKVESYWYDEIFVLDEEKLKDISGIDIVITHTAPEYCFPDNRLGYPDIVKQFVSSDPNLYFDLIKERQDMSKMFEILSKNGNKIKDVFHGHFHCKNTNTIGETTYHLLDINEFKEIL